MMKLLICACVVLSSVISISEAVQLTLLHFNDINSQLTKFEETNPPQKGEYGGFPSLIKFLEEEEGKTTNVLRIAAGNLVGGDNGWLSLVGWEDYGGLVPAFYKPKIMGLGMKEFEAGLSRTNAYLKQQMGEKFLVSNVNCSTSGANTTKEEEFCLYIKKTSTILLNGTTPFSIGVVGFVNPLVESLADPGNLVFEDVVEALTKVIANDLTGVNAVIAVGSGSMNIARDILDKVPKVKIVVLSGGTSDMTEYPTTHNNKFIVKAGSFGKTFGKLVVEVKADGSVELDGSSKLIKNDGSKGNATAAEKRVTELFNKYIHKAEMNNIGRTLVKLEGTREKCWTAECNLGNLVADSMVNCALRNVNLTDPKYADTIGIWTSGSIHDDETDPGKSIYEIDIHRWLPYHNRPYFVQIKGSVLKQIFQISGTAIKASENGGKVWGQFLQVSSGIDVTYSTSGTLRSLRVHHLSESQPLLDEVDDAKEYHVVIPSFMYLGRSVYTFLPGQFTDFQFDKIDLGFDDDCVLEYVKGLGVLSVGFEKRISITDDNDGASCKKCSGNTATTVALTLLIFVLIIGVIYVGCKFVYPRIRQRGHTSHFP